MPHSLTDSQSKDSATQLLIKYKSGALVTQKHNVILLLSATKTHNFWPSRQDIKILKTDLYYSLFFNSPCNLSQCPYSNQVHGHQPSWGWEEACFVKEALSQALLEAVTRYKESIQGRQIKGHTGGARVHRWGEKFNKFGGVLSPSFSSSLTIFVFPLPPSLFVFLSPSLSLFPPPPRLGICQKIYTTQFSGERILHTENA